MDIAEALQIAISRVIAASKLTEPEIAEVVNEKEEPLRIKIGEKLEVNKNSLILSKGLSLKKGDKVICIRKSGGQKYFVLCEIEPVPEEVVPSDTI